MIKTITVYTKEIDDIDAGIEELFANIDPARDLLKHSIGIVNCFADFIASGMIAALAEKLPFELAGTTTTAGAAGDAYGNTVLILTILTSDDVEFITGISDPIPEEDAAPLVRAYEKASAKKEGKPALMLSFAPLLMNVSGDFFVDTFSDITGNVPNFGTLAVDHNSDYHEAQTILNGEAFSNRYVFILCYGNIKPTFIIGGISDEKVFREKGVVTASKGNQLQGVNGVSVADYLLSLGLTKDADGAITGINAFPFILDYNDGTQPIIRVMFGISPEGYAVCGGNMPLGATLTVGTINAENVLSITEETLKNALVIGEQNNNKSGMLIFSCVGRYFAQGFNSDAEMEKVREVLANKMPFHLAYSGAEICPVYGKNGILKNRSHNDTIVICVF
jgi:hypothetical protein